MRTKFADRIAREMISCDKRMNCFNFLREKISESDVLVMKNSVIGNDNRRKLKVEEFRAFTIVDNYAPLIFININDTQNGKIFSLIHKLVHIWLGIFKAERFASNTDSITTSSNFAKIFPCSEPGHCAPNFGFVIHRTRNADNVVVHPKRQIELSRQRRGSKFGGGDFYKSLQSK